MNFVANKIIFDSGIISRGSSEIQLIVYWNPNIKFVSYYRSAGYLEIELNRDDNCIFSIMFFDEMQSRANEIPEIQAWKFVRLLVASSS